MNRKNDERPMQGDSGSNVADFRSRGGQQQDAGGQVSPQSHSDNGHAQGVRQKLPPEVHAFLGHKLRAVYGDLINEPVPGALLDLLDRLKAQELEAQDTAGVDQATSKEKA